MSKERMIKTRDFDRMFYFESYGVRIGLASDDADLLDDASATVAKAFGSKAKIFEDSDSGAISRIFGIVYSDGLFRLYKDGLEVSAGPSKRNFFKYLNSALRLEVAEFAEDRVFIHSGVVGWKGQAILIPGTSFSGKSTLAAELVKNGAEYYSDEYAVLEPDGRVGPFPRHISMRYFGGTREKDVSIDEIGGKQGVEPIPVGMVLLTSFSAGSRWNPEILTSGAGIMDLIQNTLTMRKNPAFSLRVLDLVAQRAIIVRSPRGDAKKFAKFLLEFFDNNYKLAKMT